MGRQIERKSYSYFSAECFLNRLCLRAIFTRVRSPGDWSRLTGTVDIGSRGSHSAQPTLCLLSAPFVVESNPTQTRPLRTVKTHFTPSAGHSIDCPPSQGQLRLPSADFRYQPVCVAWPWSGGDPPNVLRPGARQASMHGWSEEGFMRYPVVVVVAPCVEKDKWLEMKKWWKTGPRTLM